MAVQDTVEDYHCDHIEKNEGSSKHRDEFEMSSRTSRRIKNCGKVVANIETDQNSGKVDANIETGQNCGNRHEHRDVQDSDRVQDLKEFVQNDLEIKNGNKEELMDGSKLDQENTK